MKCWVNGIEADSIDIADRGLCYGDGLFETILVTNGTPHLYNQHIQRLGRGLDRLRFPPETLDLVSAELDRLDLKGDQVLKITVTRGVGPRGYAPSSGSEPSRIITLSSYAGNDQHRLTGINLRLCSQPLGINPQLAQLKHLNRLEQVLARGEWNDPDIAEGVMLDVDGYPIEGTMSNIFWVASDKICTPNVDRCGIQGVMRDHLISLLRAEGIEVDIGRYNLDDLHSAEEVFVCNSLIGIWPVVQFEASTYAIGKYTRLLQGLLQKEISS